MNKALITIWRSWSREIELAVLMLLGVAMLYHFFLRPTLEILDARRWRRTECRIVSSELGRSAAARIPAYRVDIEYIYRFDGRAYAADHYNVLSGSWGHDGTAAIVRRYPAGTHTVCYVNGLNPVEAVIDRGIPSEMYVALLPLTLAVGSGLGIAAGIKTRLAADRVQRPIEPPPQ
jgi:hypothetical protein